MVKQNQSTAKNGLKIRSENGASSGTENQTSNQSQNHTHTLTNGTAKVSTSIDYNNLLSWQSGGSRGLSGSSGYVHMDEPRTWTSTISGRTDNANQGHTHNMYLFGDTETKPDNYTYKVWKRIS